jgi:glycosyltransferase involved in cell wall biosynthesis
VNDAKRKIALVFPIFNEEGNIGPLYDAVIRTTSPLLAEYDLELVFVDDGSRDTSLEKLIALRNEDARVTVLSLSRNFGHQMAVTAGLDHAEADAVIIMDSDLQDPPRVALELVARWEAGADVVYAQRRSRKDSPFKRLTAHTFYWTLAKLASIDIPRNTGDFRLLDHRVVVELRKYREHHRFLRGMVAHLGFRQEAVLFDRDARLSGSSGYPLRKMIQFALDGILGFSTVPLQLISRMGLVLSGFAFLGVLYVIGVKLFVPSQAVPGWAFVTVAMFLMGGIQLVMLGVLGSYVGRTYVETQRRPLYALGLSLTSAREDSAPVEVAPQLQELVKPSR